MRTPHIVLAAAALFAAAGSARATVVIVPTLEEMAIASDVVADVEVVDQRVVKEGGRIITLTTVAVLDGWKGAKTGDRLEIWQLGGDIDGKSAWIVGAQHFQKGERMVIFTVKHPSAGPQSIVPYGIGFGMFDVVAKDGGLAGEQVKEVVGDVVELHPGRGETTPAVRTYDSLPAFKQTVLAALALKEAPKPMLRHKLAPHLPQAQPQQVRP